MVTHLVPRSTRGEMNKISLNLMLGTLVLMIIVMRGMISNHKGEGDADSDVKGGGRRRGGGGGEDEEQEGERKKYVMSCGCTDLGLVYGPMFSRGMVEKGGVCVCVGGGVVGLTSVSNSTPEASWRTGRTRGRKPIQYCLCWVASTTEHTKLGDATVRNTA